MFSACYEGLGLGCRSHDLGEVKRIIANCVENKVLQFVHGMEQLFPKGSHDDVDGEVVVGLETC